MYQLSCVIFLLCLSFCIQIGSCHIKMRYYEKQIAREVSVNAEQIIPRLKSKLLCAFVCSTNSNCLGYRFSDDDQCFTGEELAVQSKKQNDSSTVTFYIWKGTARCGDPPHRANARVSYEDDTVGSTATYTCDENYRTCSNNTRTVCQPTGKWDTVEMGCTRYRWKNPPRLPPTEEELVFTATTLSCGEAKRVFITVKGTPTKYTRFYLSMHQKRNIPFRFEVRFLCCGGDRKKLMVNTLKGVWDREIRRSYFPFTVGKTFSVELTYADGKYEVRSAKRILFSFKERYPGMRPSEFVVAKDVRLDLVEIYYSKDP